MVQDLTGISRIRLRRRAAVYRSLRRANFHFREERAQRLANIRERRRVVAAIVREFFRENSPRLHVSQNPIGIFRFDHNHHLIRAVIIRDVNRTVDFIDESGDFFPSGAERQHDHWRYRLVFGKPAVHVIQAAHASQQFTDVQNA